jgi:hypothetical protein
VFLGIATGHHQSRRNPVTHAKSHIRIEHPFTLDSLSVSVEVRLLSLKLAEFGHFKDAGSNAALFI